MKKTFMFLAALAAILLTIPAEAQKWAEAARSSRSGLYRSGYYDRSYYGHGAYGDIVATGIEAGTYLAGKKMDNNLARDLAREEKTLLQEERSHESAMADKAVNTVSGIAAIGDTGMPPVPPTGGPAGWGSGTATGPFYFYVKNSSLMPVELVGNGQPLGRVLGPGNDTTFAVPNPHLRLGAQRPYLKQDQLTVAVEWFFMKTTAGAIGKHGLSDGSEVQAFEFTIEEPKP